MIDLIFWVFVIFAHMFGDMVPDNKKTKVK